MPEWWRDSKTYYSSQAVNRKRKIMSSFAVTLEQVTVRPHPNADRLELARVGLFDAVVGKGQFKTGEVVFYIPEQAVLPEALIQTLGLEGKLAGKAKNRVKAVKLRGVLSQGIVAKTEILQMHPETEGYSEAMSAFYECWDGAPPEFDFAPVLGIEKWEPELPLHMSGSVTHANRLLPWIEIENIKRFPDMFTEGDEVSVTEKLHGTCTLATVKLEQADNAYTVSDVMVTSKGFAKKNLALVEDEGNLYWKAVNRFPVRDLALKAAEAFGNGVELESIGVYGETYGAGIQDLSYGATKNAFGFAVFDIFVKKANGEGFWVPSKDVQALTKEVGIPAVPVLFEGPYNIEHIASIASGKEQMSGTEANLREGVVIRSANEEERIDAFGNGHRKIAKFVTEEYLTRKGGTEFQ